MISFRIRRAECGWHPIRVASSCWTSSAFWQPSRSHLLATATCVADYHFSDKGKNALSGLHIGQMVLDGKGMVWASSYNHLDRIDTLTIRISHIRGNDAINYLMKSGNGNVWVGYNASVKCYMVNLPMKGKEVESKEWKIGDKVVSMCDVEDNIWVVAGNALLRAGS